MTSDNHTTRDDDRYRPGLEFPVVSVSAYLKLSAWYGVYGQPSHGGEPCERMKQVPFSIAGGAEPAGESREALGGLASGSSPPGFINTQSDGQRATNDVLHVTTSSDEAGGVS
jgi:hypothetical protein